MSLLSMGVKWMLEVDLCHVEIFNAILLRGLEACQPATTRLDIRAPRLHPSIINYIKIEQGSVLIPICMFSIEA